MAALERTPDPPVLLTAAEVARRLHVTVRTVYRLVARGEFPAPIRLGRKVARWREADVARRLRQGA